MHTRVYRQLPTPAKVWDLRLAEGLAGDRVPDHCRDRSTAPMSSHPPSRPDSPPPPPPPPTAPLPSDLPNENSQIPVYSTAPTTVATPSGDYEARQVGALTNTHRLTYIYIFCPKNEEMSKKVKYPTVGQQAYLQKRRGPCRTQVVPSMSFLSARSDPRCTDRRVFSRARKRYIAPQAAPTAVSVRKMVPLCLYHARDF